MRVRLDCSLPPEQVLLALRDEPWPFALTGRWASGGAIVGSAPRALLDARDDPFARLEDLPPASGDAEVGGGWFGWLGYGLGARVEALPPRPPRPVPLPDAHLAFYDNVLRQDASGRWWFEALDDECAPRRAAPAGGEPAPPAYAPRRAALEARLAHVRALLASAPEPVAPPPATFRLRAPGAAGHVAAVRDCVERIAAGEIFQANLCVRLDADWHGDVAALYAQAAARLRPDYGACFVTPWGGIVSLSPEQFLRRRGRVVTTGPIKGTSPRADDPAELRGSVKDRAEHVMIVDLMRNDLGRVAEYGSVVAPVAPEAQAHPGVWHLVSEVSARLATGAGDAALLRATFPPGSVTGAPKVQAMHVISELEATGREVYTGAIGFASPSAGLELSVAIRTFEARDGRLWLGAGGGIVADSDPEAELEECLVKARPLIAAVGGRIEQPDCYAHVEGSDPPERGRGLLSVLSGAARPATDCYAHVEGSDPPEGGRGWAPALSRERRRPDPALGVFETLLVEHGEPVHLREHLARLARSVAALYGEELPTDIAEQARAAARDGSLRIDVVPGQPVRFTTRPLRERSLPIVLRPYTLPGGLGEHKWRDRRLLDALAADGTTPLLFDADGTVLEAAWATLLVRRDGRLLTPREDGRILPGTSRPAAEQADLRLQPDDELLVSSSLAGLVPAVLAATSPAPRSDRRRTPSRSGG